MRTRSAWFSSTAFVCSLALTWAVRGQTAPAADTATAPVAPVATPAAPPSSPATPAADVAAPTAAAPSVVVPVPPPAEPPPMPTAPAVAKPAEVAPADTTAAKPADAAAPAKTEEGAKGAATKSKDAAGRDTLSVDFPDEDVRNILRNVADLFELNIIMPETLQGKTTIKLRDVTWRQIFQSVLDPVGYTYTEEGNIIKIVSKDSLNEEPVMTDVFLINYAKATDILPTISSLVDTTKGKIVVDARTNSLVITERPTRMSRIRPIIEQLDRATDQVMIETKFVEVTNTDVKNLGVNWSSLANYQIKAGNLGGTFNRTQGQNGSGGFSQNDSTNKIGSVGTTGSTNTTATNSATVTSNNGSPTSTSSTGTSATIANGTTNSQSDSTSNAYNLLSSLTNNNTTARALNAVFSATDFSLVLSALQQLQNTKIVSNPTIVTLNNTPAVINVGQERPIPSYTYNQQTGTYEVSGFTYKPIGIILRVTPQVNSRGFIKLTVDPEVSQSTRDATFNGAAIPIVETRKASTTVSLKDGFTMGIGGLLQSSTNNSVNKVPLLGSIPGLGRLFRSDNKNMEQTNLIIFITAKTISAEGATVEQLFDSDRVRGLDMKREDLPGHRDGTDPFLPSMPPPKAAAHRATAPTASK
jgi:type II secretory pathway component GspD/PulD (secretin)